jgi:hypothetical protein
LVQVRSRHCFVEDTSTSGDEREVLHRVSLECVDDDAIGERPVPAARALSMARVSLRIADDVGLGDYRGGEMSCARAVTWLR